jgi:hypothetical protein
VAMMGLIFGTARCAHVWIGDRIGSTKWTLRYIRRTQQKMGENLPLNEVTPLLDSQLVLTAGFAAGFGWQIERFTRTCRTKPACGSTVLAVE